MNNLRYAISLIGSAAELARLSNTSASYISQIITGHKNPTGTVRSVGYGLARKIEIALSEYHGWMDMNHSKEIEEHGKLFSTLVSAHPTLTLAKIAREVGYSDGHMQQWMRRGVPAKFAPKIATMLGCDITDISIALAPGNPNIINEWDDPMIEINAMKTIMNAIETLNKDERENVIRLIVMLYKIDLNLT